MARASLARPLMSPGAPGQVVIRRMDGDETSESPASQNKRRVRYCCLDTSFVFRGLLSVQQRVVDRLSGGIRHVFVRFAEPSRPAWRVDRIQSFTDHEKFTDTHNMWGATGVCTVVVLTKMARSPIPTRRIMRAIHYRGWLSAS